MDSIAGEVLRSPNALVLFLLASPSIALAGFVVYYAWSKQRIQNGNGNGGRQYEPALTRTEFYQRTEAVRLEIMKSVDDKLEDILTMLSAVRKENRSYADSIIDVRERVVVLETRARAGQ